jgi:ATP-dependent Lon protease
MALAKSEFEVTDEALLKWSAATPAKPACVTFERELMKLSRKAVKELILKTGQKKKVKVTRTTWTTSSACRAIRYGEAELEDQVGVVTGLAWTEVGGELLTIEGVMMPGKGKMTVTGNLRDVMKESISAAASYVRSRSTDFGVEPPTVRQARHPRPRARRRDAQGWSVGRCRHGHGHRLDHDRHPGAP